MWNFLNLLIGGESSGTEDTEEAVNRHDKIKYISRSIYKRRPKKPGKSSVHLHDLQFITSLLCEISSIF